MNSSVYILVRSWNNFFYLKQCLKSIRMQKDNDYKVLFVDDASDYTEEQKEYIQEMLKGQIIVFNTTRKYGARNAYEMIHTYIKNDAIIINLDGDDWFESNTVISKVLDVYHKTNCLLTYGNCRYYAPNTYIHNTIASTQNMINHRYPKNIEAKNAYRDMNFLPLHLRSWKASVFRKIKSNSFLRPDNSWLRSCEDEAMFFPMLEMSNGRYEVISEVLYVYNRENASNESKIYKSDLLFDETCIYRGSRYAPI